MLFSRSLIQKLILPSIVKILLSRFIKMYLLFFSIHEMYFIHKILLGSRDRANTWLFSRVIFSPCVQTQMQRFTFVVRSPPQRENVGKSGFHACTCGLELKQERLVLCLQHYAFFSLKRTFFAWRKNRRFTVLFTSRTQNLRHSLNYFCVIDQFHRFVCAF